MLYETHRATNKGAPGLLGTDGAAVIYAVADDDQRTTSINPVRSAIFDGQKASDCAVFAHAVRDDLVTGT